MKSPIDILFAKADMRCTVCNAQMRTCDCWARCNHCGCSYLRDDGRCLRCPLEPGDRGYYEWARSLSVGDVVIVIDPNTSDEIRTGIERVTKSQYIVSDGRRFRRSGQFPGYRVGEDGRSARSYIIAHDRTPTRAGTGR